ncbi:GNAT family N-acetyltransferase [Paraburkholderia bonniea]|uniref:GNAT family N-acetyltransferase n=1 Tax=Paraburkholderia bonniea TaxID=2152891 RepID=UPI0012923C15|nr:GNAT family N-acetyltransferase [Paraburkholderia bonniea]WJF89472.1 GNAT family N-acetyltransferase [Paraburkholderia bonniea]WJF92787.1 GNAT family N-acetyltransferase [Paraburkholderia bonniea]
MTQSTHFDRPSQPALTLTWRWSAFDEFTPGEIYDVLAARSAVFVVEQNCVYGDIDGQDKHAWHLRAHAAMPDGLQLAACLRVLVPDSADPDVRIGRVLTCIDFRGFGLGRALMEQALAHIGVQWPGVAMRLHAQAHLQPFYAAFGFTPVSEIHDEDGIAHVWMRSSCNRERADSRIQ